MITVSYCRLMARYNRWQNRSLVDAADGLSDTARWRDRGAFFGSIARTFNHLLWDDALWIARIKGNERPERTIKASIDQPADWAAYKSARADRDAVIIGLVDGLLDVDLEAGISWYPGGGENRIVRPAALCLVHLFNHQIHHRGQIHAMLTSAGAQPDATDLPMLPD